MQHRDGKLDEDLFDNSEPISSFVDDREPQVTADGYDYGTLLYHFQEVVDHREGMVQPHPNSFVAPGPSCTFSIH